MADTTKAPATHSQPSRKGKAAWRKNIDIEPVTSGVEAAQEDYRQTGLRPGASIEHLYTVDLVGDDKIRRRLHKGQPKLKADQILARRSRVPAVEARKSEDTETALKRKHDSIALRKERARLWKLANSGGKGADHNVAESAEAASYDPWAVPEAHPPDPRQSFLEAQKPLREPDTLRKAPLSLAAGSKTVPSVPKPHAGRSYNPQFDAWSTLLKQAGDDEVEEEKLRLRQAAEEQEQEERAAIVAAEVEQGEKERTVMSDYESEWEGFQSEPDETQLKARRPERKTPAERNKIKRRKEADALERHESQMRVRDKQVRQFDELKRAMDKENRQKIWMQSFEGFGSDADSDLDGDHEVKLAKRPRLGKKFVPPSQDLELTLPHELKDSLRLLRPEGNLLKDRYRTMILQGKTEGRTPLPMQKKPKREKTEKWSYKDWTLDNA